MRYIQAFASRKPKERGLAITHLLLDMAELVQVEFVGCRIGRLFDLNDEQILVIMSWFMDDDIGEDASLNELAIRVRILDVFGNDSPATIFDMEAVIAERTLQNGGKAGAYCAFADVEFRI